MPPTETEVTQQELGRRIARTTRQVRNLTEEGVFTRIPSAKNPNQLVYPWPASLHRWIAHQVAQEAQRNKATTTDEALRRKLAADAEIAEMKAAKLRGDLVDVETFRSVLSAVLERVRLRVDAIPGEYGSQVLGLSQLSESVPILRTLAESIAAELREAGAPPADEDEEADEPPPPAQAA